MLLGELQTRRMRVAEEVVAGDLVVDRRTDGKLARVEVDVGDPSARLERTDEPAQVGGPVRKVMVCS